MSNRIFLTILLLFSLFSSTHLAHCPVSSSTMMAQCTSFLILDSLTVSFNGVVPLQQGQDVQCYNYTLANSFNTKPNIAIGTSLMTQLLTRWTANIQITFSSRSKSQWWKPTRWSPSSLELTGDILLGKKYPSHSSLKNQQKLKPATIKLTHPPYPHVQVVK